MHENSGLLFCKYVMPMITEGMKILEIGPDGFPSSYRSLVKIDNIIWDTLDIYESKNLTYSKSDFYHFDIPDNHYDMVFSDQVIEHVSEIWNWLPELARVTKKSGFVVTINPVSWPYHQAPIDCWRIYPEGMKALCKHADLTIQLSKFESLENTHFKRSIPGRSAKWQPKVLNLFFNIVGRIGFPVEKSFDTITIAVKK